MKLNGILVKGNEFVYDGCHKIYILEDEKDKEEAKNEDYCEVYPINQLEEVFNRSCPLRFVYNWKLTTYYVKQHEELEITE